MDDQQRARALLAQEWRKLSEDAPADMLEAGCELPPLVAAAVAAITAALRAAPESVALRAAPERELYEASRAFYNTISTIAVVLDLKAFLPESWKLVESTGARLCVALLNQHGVAVVADSSQVVPPPALGAHEVHPEAVHAGIDLGKAGERLLAADALEHASGVREDCDGSATAQTVALRTAMETLEQIATAPDDRGAKFNAASCVAFLTTQGAAGQEWRPIEAAPEGRLVVVGWMDTEDSHYPENYDFDYLEDGLWAKHADCVEHAHAVAPSGSKMPKEQPPYQWWMDLPAFPAARPQGVK